MITYSLVAGSHLKLFTEGDVCLSGSEMDRMTDLDLERVIKSVTIFYRSSPKHKLRIVKVCLLLNHLLHELVTYSKKSIFTPNLNLKVGFASFFCWHHLFRFL